MQTFQGIGCAIYTFAALKYSNFNFGLISFTNEQCLYSLTLCGQYWNFFLFLYPVLWQLLIDMWDSLPSSISSISIIHIRIPGYIICNTSCTKWVLKYELIDFRCIAFLTCCINQSKPIFPFPFLKYTSWLSTYLLKLFYNNL